MGEGRGLQRQEHWTLKSLQRGERKEEIISRRYQTEVPIYDDLLCSHGKSCPGEWRAKTAIHQAAAFLFLRGPTGRLSGGPPPKKDYYSPPLQMTELL